GRTICLLIAGLICGLFWESCNYWAGSKWVYQIPYVGFAKLFEMPVLGFLGFLPFALEVHAFYEAARLGWTRATPAQRKGIELGAGLFCAAVFRGIDHWTVIGW